MGGFGAFLGGAVVGGLSGVNKRIDEEEELRRKMGLAEYAASMKAKYEEASRRSAFAFETDPANVAIRRQIAKDDAIAAAETKAEITMMPGQVAARDLLSDEAKTAAVDTAVAKAEALVPVEIAATSKKSAAEFRDTIARMSDIVDMTVDMGIVDFGQDEMVALHSAAYSTLFPGLDWKTPTEKARLKAVAEANGGKGDAVQAARYTVGNKIVVEKVAMATANALDNALSDPELIPEASVRNDLMSKMYRFVGAMRAGADPEMAERTRNTLVKAVREAKAKGTFPKGDRLIEWMDQVQAEGVQVRERFNSTRPTETADMDTVLQRFRSFLDDENATMAAFDLENIDRTLAGLTTQADTGRAVQQQQNPDAFMPGLLAGNPPKDFQPTLEQQPQAAEAPLLTPPPVAATPEPAAAPPAPTAEPTPFQANIQNVVAKLGPALEGRDPVFIKRTVDSYILASKEENGGWIPAGQEANIHQQIMKALGG
jgi:hypothetical protein